jgi:hypothetical protein
MDKDEKLTELKKIDDIIKKYEDERFEKLSEIADINIKVDNYGR